MKPLKQRAEEALEEMCHLGYGEIISLHDTVKEIIYRELKHLQLELEADFAKRVVTGQQRIDK